MEWRGTRSAPSYRQSRPQLESAGRQAGPPHKKRSSPAPSQSSRPAARWIPAATRLKSVNAVPTSLWCSRPELAGSIERGLPRRDIRALVDQYVGELLNSVDTTPAGVILGCTHAAPTAY